MTYRKKLIEVALPLDDINREASREKVYAAQRTPIHTTPLVGAATISSVPSGAVCLTCR